MCAKQIFDVLSLTYLGKYMVDCNLMKFDMLNGACALGGSLKKKKKDKNIGQLFSLAHPRADNQQ